MQTDRQTDMTKLTVAFRNSSNAPKKAAAVLELAKHQSTNTPIQMIVNFFENSY